MLAIFRRIRRAQDESSLLKKRVQIYLLFSLFISVTQNADTDNPHVFKRIQTALSTTSKIVLMGNT